MGILLANCNCCGGIKELVVNPVDFDNWKARKVLIQDAMPYLAAEDRELLISKTCGVCWNALFSEEEAA
jgi:hypothetical protein